MFENPGEGPRPPLPMPMHACMSFVHDQGRISHMALFESARNTALQNEDIVETHFSKQSLHFVRNWSKMIVYL